MLTMRKRGRVWHVRGTVRVGKETRIVKESSTGCVRKEDAEQYIAKFEYDLRQALLHGEAEQASLMTFADAGLHYLERPGGIARREADYLKKLAEVMGDDRIADILPAWKRFRELRCVDLKPATVDRYRAVAQAAINYAAAETGFVAPRLPRQKFKNGIVRHLTLDQQEHLLAAYPDHVRPVALMLCFQGCRTQEALQLQWLHVDFEKGTLYFNRTKNGEPRTVLMHLRVRRALEGLHSALGGRAAGNVFLNRHGAPWADTRDYKLRGGNPIRKAHLAACKGAGIEDFRVHDWRHHWASWCVMKGIDLLTVQKMGGWKSLAMLERYASVSTEHMAEAMEKLA